MLLRHVRSMLEGGRMNVRSIPQGRRIHFRSMQKNSGRHIRRRTASGLLLNHHSAPPLNISNWTGSAASSFGFQIQGPEAMGSRESAPRICCCQRVYSVAEQSQSA
jgi:hypothetical protein